jgi:putative FmdB family regulatory protein
MPIYEYRCQECGATFDKFVRSMANAATIEVECPQCRSKRCRKSISLFGTTGSDSGASAGACAPTG